jgi:CRP-like cAMP-binding protein
LFEPDRLRENVYVICDGWAFRFRRFEDGRRYILNFLTAGDVVYGEFSESPGFSLQALTDIRYCQFVRAEVKPCILGQPRNYDAWMAACIAERNELAATAAALAQLSAAERIARLILHLRDRLDAHEMVHNESCVFPLRQTHIADATGLTTVHVSRTLSAFRKDGVLAIDDGKFTILNLAKLRRMVERK